MAVYGSARDHMPFEPKPCQRDAVFAAPHDGEDKYNNRPTKEPSVRLALAGLEKAISLAIDALDSLHGRLRPAMGADKPSDPVPKDPTKPPCELACAIDEQRERINALTYKLHDVINRLEI